MVGGGAGGQGRRRVSSQTTTPQSDHSRSWVLGGYRNPPFCPLGQDSPPRALAQVPTGSVQIQRPSAQAREPVLEPSGNLYPNLGEYNLECPPPQQRRQPHLTFQGNLELTTLPNPTVGAIGVPLASSPFPETRHPELREGNRACL